MKLFEQIEIVGNEKFIVRRMESEFYYLNIILSKDSKRKHIEVKEKSEIKFVPCVYISRDFSSDVFKIEVQTTSFGSLSVDDFTLFYQTQHESSEHIKEIRAILKDEGCTIH